jgi:hypothetical protein
MEKHELYESLTDETKKWVSEQIAGVNQGLFIWWLLIVLSVIAPFLALFLKPSSQEIGVWFQRSGAITVVLSLLAEIKYNSIENTALPKTHEFLYCNMYLKMHYETKVKIINYLNFTVVAAGTIVWGYGDLLLSLVYNA